MNIVNNSRYKLEPPPEQPTYDRRHFVYYPEEGRYVLPGGEATDGDTFAEQVRRAGRRATVIRVEYGGPIT